MATEVELRQIEKAFSQPATWKMTGTLGALLASLPRIGGKSPIRYIDGKEEEMMNKLGYTTAWTDFNTITFTSKFLNKLTKIGVAFILLHELGHIAFKHKSRMRGRNPDIWNIAGDIKINDAIVRHIMPNFLKTEKEFHAGVLFNNTKPMGLGFTTDTATWLDKYREYIEEEIYYLMEEDLRSQREQEQKKGNGKGNGRSGGGGGGGFDLDQAKADAFDDHMDSGLELRKKLEEEFGDEGKQLADSMDLAESAEQQKEKEAAASKSLNNAKQLSKTANKGNKQIGSHIDDFIEQAIEIDRTAQAKYQWKFEVSGIMQDANIGPYIEDLDLADELSEWSKIPELRDQMGLGEIYRADLVRKSCTANLLHIQDTSGSMSDEDIKLSLVEEKEIATNSRLDLTFVSADTVARDKIVFTADDLLEFPTSLPIKGRGGTDMFTPLVEEIVSNEKAYDLALIFTDGYFTPFTSQELITAIAKKDPLKVAFIPPIAFVITTDYYDNPELNKAAATFQQGKCKVYGLLDPLARTRSNEITISNGSIGM